MKVLVTGGRDYDDAATLFNVLTAIDLGHGISQIIEGCAAGADHLAERWAIHHEVHNRHFPADWELNGRAAGPIRNQRMLDVGKPDMVVAFPGGRGTADMVRRARRAGVPVRVVPSRLSEGLGTS